MEKGEKPKVEKAGMEEKRGRRGLGHTPEEKCRAVLSVWTERRKPGEVCRELGVAWGILKQWEDRALQAMVQALENHAPGRPSAPLDAEKEELQRKVRDLEKKLYLAEQVIEVKELLSAYECFRAGGTKKNKRKKQKAGKRRSAE